MKHQTHSGIVSRLKRVEGHMRSVIAMIEAERSCLDLAQQLHAIEKAVSSAKRELIHDHIEHCLEEDESTGTGLKEIKQLTKYL